MSEVKFHNFSGIKNEQHNPRAIAQVQLKNGMAVVITVDSTGKELASLPDATTAKGDVKFVRNVIDKPELLNKSDYRVNVGEYVRAFTFQKGELLEISADLITDTTLAIGDKIVPNVSGTYTKSTATDYTVNLVVVKKTTFCGAGYIVRVA